MITINPYLSFNGNCEEAFNFYQSINETFWGSYFGDLMDKFGIHWMISFDLKGLQDKALAS